MPPDSIMDEAFEQLSRSIMDEVLSWDPSYATQAGWHKYDRLLRNPSEEELERQARRCSELVRTLENATGSALSPDQEIDRDLAVYLMRLKLFELKELRLHERESTACGDIGYALFFLFARDHPAFDDRVTSIVHRLEAIPEFLEKSRTNIHSPYRTWIEASLETGSEVPVLLKEIERLAEERSEDHSTMERLRAAVVRATHAVQEHNELIKNEVLPRSSDTLAVSPEEYAKYFERRGYGISADQALEVGETYLRIVKRRMGDLAKQIVPSGNVAEALDKMKSDHPTSFQQAVDAYRASVLEAREFLRQKDLMTIPDGERLLVVETPEFMRPMTPFAAQFEPGKFDGNRTGMFLVTPDDGNTEYLREHCYASIANTTVHEGYPGHHLQGICSNTNPSYIRMLVASPDFSEGWGLYTEDLMISLGYNDSPLGRLTNMNDLLFRIVRLVVEIRLAKGTITPDEGARMLAEECVIDANAARKEARSCSMNPTYYSSYFIGKLAVMQLREEVEKAMGDEFSFKFFHDALLYTGCLPMPFMRRSVALKLREKHGIDLGEQKETLYEYAMRKAGAEGA